MSLPNRFTDTDVRRHTQLRDVALEYVLGYDGEFEPMIEARRVVDAGGTLDVALIRRTLNCLRADLDPRVRSLQREAASALVVRYSNDDDDTDVVRPAARSHLRVVPEEKKARAWSVRTAVKITLPYGSPRAKQGAIHVVESAYCDWRLPQLWGDTKRERARWKLNGSNRRPQLTVYWACGNGTSDAIFFADDGEVKDRNYCKAGCWSEDE